MGGKGCGSVFDCSKNRADANGAKATLETTEQEVKEMRQRASEKNEANKQIISQRNNGSVRCEQPVPHHRSF